MKCFSCGQSFNGDVNELLRQYKLDYINRGIERYFYREEKNGDIKIINQKNFKQIFKTKIKPNFSKGAEYAHIREFG